MNFPLLPYMKYIRIEAHQSHITMHEMIPFIIRQIRIIQLYHSIYHWIVSSVPWNYISIQCQARQHFLIFFPI